MDFITLLDIANPKKMKYTMNLLINSYNNFHDETVILTQGAIAAAENAEQAAINAEGSAKTIESAVLTSTDLVIAAEGHATESANNAETAANSAANAETHATASAASADLAAASASAALTAANNAQISAEISAESASSANTASQNAQMSADNAEQAVINAAHSASIAEEAAVNSANSVLAVQNSVAEAAASADSSAASALEAVETAEMALNNTEEAIATAETAMNVAIEAKSIVDQALDLGAIGTFVYDTNHVALQSIYLTDNPDTPDTENYRYVATPDMVRTALSNYVTQDSVQSFKRLLGQIITSILPQEDTKLHLLDGSVLSGDGIYADFVTHIATLYVSYPALFVSEESWQNGQKGKFVYNSTNNTVRLPQLSNRFLVSGTIASLGNLGGNNSHTLTIEEMPSHTHIQNTHNHIQNAHTHTQNSHNHSQNAHNHSQNAHAHSIASSNSYSNDIIGYGYNANSQGVGGTKSGAYVSYYWNDRSGIQVINNNTATNNENTATNNATIAVNQETIAVNQETIAVNQNTGGGQAFDISPLNASVLYYIVVAQ